ncbi:MAG: DUF1501 domain-containing protein [Actinomycetota bacterium]
MITLEGGSHRLCNGLTRRDALRVGTLGIAGFALSDLLQLQAQAAVPRRKAKSIIMIHLGGGPSHVDTYDPKPDAPEEIRGEFKAIPTKVDGIQIGELFPRQAQMMDQLAILRSCSKVFPEEHASSLMVTGYSNTERRAQGEHPSIGSVLTKLRSTPDALMPAYVSLRGINIETGLNAGFLGPSCEPLAYDGPGREDLKLRVAANRLDGRRKMLDKLNGFRRAVDAGAIESQNVFTQRALELVASTSAYDALDIGKETEETRKRYGMEHFLRARRLVERGVQCVAIEVGGWDTHSDNFKQLRSIMPPLDQAFTELVKDLKDRGLYDETLIVMWGEFGRTPKVNGTAGRDHWPHVMSVAFAGGGLKMGQAIGTTDQQAMYATEQAYTVRHVVATLYHALGIDPSMSFIDGQSRPIPLIHDAEPIPELIR